MSWILVFARDKNNGLLDESLRLFLDPPTSTTLHWLRVAWRRPDGVVRWRTEQQGGRASDLIGFKCIRSILNVPSRHYLESAIRIDFYFLLPVAADATHCIVSPPHLNMYMCVYISFYRSHKLSVTLISGPSSQSPAPPAWRASRSPRE